MEKIKRTPAHEVIRKILAANPGRYLATHEIGVLARQQGNYFNDNAASSRLCIELKGKVDGRIREGTQFKEWSLIEPLGNNGEPLPKPMPEQANDELIQTTIRGY